MIVIQICKSLWRCCCWERREMWVSASWSQHWPKARISLSQCSWGPRPSWRSSSMPLHSLPLRYDHSCHCTKLSNPWHKPIRFGYSVLDNSSYNAAVLLQRLHLPGERLGSARWCWLILHRKKQICFVSKIARCFAASLSVRSSVYKAAWIRDWLRSRHPLVQGCRFDKSATNAVTG